MPGARQDLEAGLTTESLRAGRSRAAGHRAGTVRRSIGNAPGPAENVPSDTSSSGPHATAGGDDRCNITLALVVIAAAQLMVVLDASIVNVALPHIQRALTHIDC